MIASQPIGRLGPREGPAVRVECPPADAFRSIVGLPVLLLLLVRKANRATAAPASLAGASNRARSRLSASWILILVLAAVYLLLGAAERVLNGYLLFHYHQYICSSVADLLWFFAVSVAIVLASSDALQIPWRLLRFVIVTLQLFLCTTVQIMFNPWPFLDAGKWAVLFGVMLALFMIGNAIVRALLRRLAGPRHFGGWYGWFCVVFGVAPLLALWIAEAYMSRSVQLQSTQEAFRMLVLLTAAICLPYAIFFSFVFPAQAGWQRVRFLVASPSRSATQKAPGCGWLRDRLARAFGLAGLVPEDAQ